MGMKARPAKKSIIMYATRDHYGDYYLCSYESDAEGYPAGVEVCGSQYLEAGGVELKPRESYDSEAEVVKVRVTIRKAR